MPSLETPFSVWEPRAQFRNPIPSLETPFPIWGPCVRPRSQPVAVGHPTAAASGRNSAQIPGAGGPGVSGPGGAAAASRGWVSGGGDLSPPGLQDPPVLPCSPPGAAEEPGLAKHGQGRQQGWAGAWGGEVMTGVPAPPKPHHHLQHPPPPPFPPPPPPLRVHWPRLPQRPLGRADLRPLWGTPESGGGDTEMPEQPWMGPRRRGPDPPTLP